MAHRHGGNSNYNGQYQTKVDMSCCDHYAHNINGRWECGIEPGSCTSANKMSTYSQGGYPANPPRRQGYIADSLGDGRHDDVPALLTAGEYVIRRDSTQKYGEQFLDRLNQGLVNPQSVMGLNRGGRVKTNNRRNTVKRQTRRPARRNVRRTSGNDRARVAAPNIMNRGGKVNTQPQRYMHGGGVRRTSGTQSSLPGGRSWVKIDYTKNANQGNFWLTSYDQAEQDQYWCPGAYFTADCQKTGGTSVYDTNISLAISGQPSFHNSNT